MSETFDAYVLEEQGPAVLSQLSEQDLPDAEVTVDVSHSSLNYKDGLAMTGKGRIARRFPMVCGIDLAGIVAESRSADWHAGDEVVVTGWGLSETWPGGYTRRQRVRPDMLVRKPATLSLSQSMAVGTAGLTAMLCVLRLERAGVTRTRGRSIVTGRPEAWAASPSRCSPGLATRSTPRPGGPPSTGATCGSSARRRSWIARSSPRRPGDRLSRRNGRCAVDTVGAAPLVTVLKQTRVRLAPSPRAAWRRAATCRRPSCRTSCAG